MPANPYNKMYNYGSMDFKPPHQMTRATMRELRIMTIVKQIHREAIIQAERENSTIYHYNVPTSYTDVTNTTKVVPPFYRDNMPAILAGLREAFTDCSVTNEMVLKGPGSHKELYNTIIIDWS